MLEFRLLGALDVSSDGSPVELGGVKPRALLALLLVERGRAVPARRLIDGLWGAGAPPSAAKALQVYVSQLRRALGGAAIETRADAYLLRAVSSQVDLDRFEELAGAGRSQLDAGRPADASRLLAEALALWRGDALEGLDEPGLAPARARLDELRLTVQELQNDAGLAAGEQARILPDLTLLARRHPLRERLQEQLMLALYRDGRQAEALAVFRTLRERLRDELGLEPRGHARALEQAVLRQDPALELAEAHPAEPRGRVIVAAAGSPGRIAALAVPLARRDGGELVLLAPVGDSGALGAAARALEEHRAGDVRVAAFVTRSPGRDALRLAAVESASLVLLEVSRAAAGEQLDPEVARAPMDVGLFVDAAGPIPGERIGVLFGGAPADWQALETAAALARAHGVPLRLLGAERGDADSSTLLARAALVVQRFAGIATEPALFDPSSADSLRQAVAGGLLVAGVPVPGGEEGSVPPAAPELLAAGAPLVLVRGGPQPGVLAPAGTVTRFSWSLG